MIRLSKKLLKHLGETPTAALSLFGNSFVQLRASEDNNYVIDNGRPTIEIVPYGYTADVALFHELGHFSAVSEAKLLKENYGFGEYRFLCRTMKGYDDVLHELRVLALEWNLMEWFGYTSCSDKQNYVNWLNGSMPGIDNFAKALNLKSSKEIDKELCKQFLEMVDTQEYSVPKFLETWKARNDFLFEALSGKK